MYILKGGDFICHHCDIGRSVKPAADKHFYTMTSTVASSVAAVVSPKELVQLTRRRFVGAQSGLYEHIQGAYPPIDFITNSGPFLWRKERSD